MDTRTGKIIDNEAFNQLTHEEKENYIQITRDLTHKEKYEAQIRLYSACACGSGKKFKFCCKKSEQ